MRTLDRYILRNFIISALLWFAVLMSLRIVSDLFVNMDEFTKAKDVAKTAEMIVRHVGTYYAYHSLAYFRELGGVIIVAAAAFVLARMNHTNELTAILASGVSLHRVLLPVVVCAIGLNLLIVLDTEVLIPRFRQQLSRSRDDVEGRDAFHVRLMIDRADSSWFSRELVPTEQKLMNPVIILRGPRLTYAGKITGPEATYEPDWGGWAFRPAPQAKAPHDIVHPILHVAGWRRAPTTEKIPTRIGPEAVIRAARADPANATVRWRDAAAIEPVGVRDRDVNLMIRADGLDLAIDGERVIGTVLRNARFEYTRDDGRPMAHFVAASAVYDDDPRDPGWLLRDASLVYVSDLTPGELALRRSGNWLQYMSTAEMTRLLRLHRSGYAEQAMFVRHARFADFLNNIILLLVGLPFILSRERNIKSSAGLALLSVGGAYVFIYLTRYVGLHPAVAAWLPILVLGPVSALMIDAVKT